MTDFRKKFIPGENKELYSSLHNELNDLMMPSLDQNRLEYKGQNGSVTADMFDIQDVGNESHVKALLLYLCSGAANWNSKNFHYNVGAPVNCFSYFSYAFALSHNIIATNDGLSGNALIAEKMVVNILKKLANVDELAGWFTFGGTGTNLYAAKVGLKKSHPVTGRQGVDKNTVFLTTKNSHFSHFVAADWLGIGTDNVIHIKSNDDGSTSLEDFCYLMEHFVTQGKKIGCIYLNGGTSYNHIIDEIKDFAFVRDIIVKKYNLSYSPHIHVDSVIGWFWLFFSEYDFSENSLNIKPESLTKIRHQYEKIAQLKYADSWGADFHKGIGGCPVDSSIFLLNRTRDKDYLSKKKDCSIKMHQIAEEFSVDSPVDFTLENSRSAGPMLSALTSLISTGKNGFRKYLATLVGVADGLRDLLSGFDDICLCDNYRQGFVIMMRCYPPGFRTQENIHNSALAELQGDICRDDIEKINAYNNALFKFFLLKKRNIEFSYSSSFLSAEGDVNIHAMKIYLMSPFLDEKDARNLAEFIITEKRKYDAMAEGGKGSATYLSDKVPTV
jgi:L-2,4-diaminobutyrate decarboxylase